MSKQNKKNQTKRRQAKKSRNIKQRKQKKYLPVMSKYKSEIGYPLKYFYPKKLSEVILEYAEPLIDAACEKKEEENAIRLGITLWNASLLPKQKSLEIFDPMLKNLADENPKIKEEMLSIFEMMYNRKQTLYKLDNLFVANYSLEENEQGFYLEVASTSISCDTKL